MLSENLRTFFGHFGAFVGLFFSFAGFPTMNEEESGVTFQGLLRSDRAIRWDRIECDGFVEIRPQVLSD